MYFPKKKESKVKSFPIIWVVMEMQKKSSYTKDHKEGTEVHKVVFCDFSTWI